jgi:hypothetical protein
MAILVCWQIRGQHTIATACKRDVRARGSGCYSAPTFCGWWHAARCPPTCATSGGSSTEQMSVA